MSRPLTEGPRPECPRGHTGSIVFWGPRVRPDGLFAKSRYRCTPPPGCGERHWFTLPKRAPWHLNPDGTMCANCSHEPGRTDGAPTAPRSLYSVPEAARLLLDLGSGKTMRGASRALRIENNRWSYDAAGRKIRSRQNALAADYLDRYGPVIVAGTRPKRWPRFLILDSVPLYMRVRDAEALGLPYEAEGGAILVAAGTDDTALAAHAWHATLAGNETGQIWFDFLDSIDTDEEPAWVVADDASAIRSAVAAKWPNAVFYPCVYHLRERSKLAAVADNLTWTDPAIEPAIETCFRSTDDWDRLRALAKPHGRGSLWSWIEANDERARSLAPLRRRFEPGVPEGNGAAEHVVSEIRDRIGDRKRNFLNARRLAILVELMRADIAGVASARRYIGLLRDAQEAAQWTLGAADDPGWRAYQDPFENVSSMSRMIYDARERAKLAITHLATESQGRGVRRRLDEQNANRVERGEEPWEISTDTAIPRARIPKGTRLTAFHELMRDWDPANDRDPATLTYGVDYRASWICANCGNKWRAPVNQRTIRLTRCKVCHRDWASPATSLAALHPELVATEWATEENYPRTPDRVLASGKTAVFWRCRDLPDLHPVFRMTPRTRLKHAAAGTPACTECRRTANAQAKARRRHDGQAHELVHAQPSERPATRVLISLDPALDLEEPF